ncbi:MAG: ABC transporter permease [Bacteroidales bacterium]
MNIKTKEFLEESKWVYALGGSIFLWLSIGFSTKTFNFDSLLMNVISASFLIIPALGQMIVISCGRGSIDLSIPNLITLTAYFSTGIIDGKNENLLYGLIAVIIVSFIVGLINGFTTIYLRIPSLISTLSIGYILTTITLIYRESFQTFNISPILLSLARGRFLGCPIIIIIMSTFALLSFFIVFRTNYGRCLIAIGQNIDAAKLSGVNTDKVQIIAFILSSILAGLSGILIAARAGGAFLGMGDSYLLETVGAVVIGGTLIFGGKSTVFGTIVGGIFLTLIVTAMQIAGFPVGTQNILKGLLIILVLFVATKEKE